MEGKGHCVNVELHLSIVWLIAAVIIFFSLNTCTWMAYFPIRCTSFPVKKMSTKLNQKS